MSGPEVEPICCEFGEAPGREGEKTWCFGAWTAVFPEGSMDGSTLGKIFAVVVQPLSLARPSLSRLGDGRLLWSSWQLGVRFAKDTTLLTGVGEASCCCRG